MPDVLWVPLASALLVAIAGGAGLATGNVWLFPSLGPTAVAQAHSPGDRSNSLRSVVLGHLLGLAAGHAGVFLAGAAVDPPVLAGGQLTGARVLAAILAVVLTALSQIALRASHPPAAATTLLVALGAFPPTLQGALHVVVGVLVVGLPGEALRRIRARSPR
ncbi:MAG TPA: HPP family protein [Longimicrobiaceae bacterium]|nr:HPP family protein [Longimicrobiaceae bacterium]